MSTPPAARPRGRPRAEPRDTQRARLVAVARDAFADEGFGAVTLSAIAERAGVSRAAAYEVVGTKDDLLGAVAEQVAEEFLARLDQHFARRSASLDLPLDEMLRGDIGWFVELMVTEPAYARLIALSGRLSNDERDPVRRARERVEDRLTELHEARATSLGLHRSAVARILSVGLLAMVERIALRVVEEGWPTTEVAHLVGDFATGGYLRTEETGSTEALEAASEARLD